MRSDNWLEIKSWFFNMKPKEEQDYQLLLEQIKEAGIKLHLPFVLAVKKLTRLRNRINLFQLSTGG